MPTNKKIVCFSDTHGQHRNLKLNKWFENNPADILIFAGDCQMNDQDNGEDFVDWMSKLPYRYKLVVPGNHDNNFVHIKELIKRHFKVYFVVHDSITVEGIRFFCSAYSRTFGNWWFMESESVLEYLYEKIPENTEILVTHTPPFEKLDKTFMGINAGSVSLGERITKLPNLQYNIFGHIHESNGSETIDGIRYINCSVTNKGYNLVNMPYIFEFEKK